MMVIQIFFSIFQTRDTFLTESEGVVTKKSLSDSPPPYEGPPEYHSLPPEILMDALSLEDLCQHPKTSDTSVQISSNIQRHDTKYSAGDSSQCTHLKSSDNSSDDANSSSGSSPKRFKVIDYAIPCPSYSEAVKSHPSLSGLDGNATNSDDNTSSANGYRVELASSSETLKESDHQGNSLSKKKRDVKALVSRDIDWPGVVSRESAERDLNVNIVGLVGDTNQPILVSEGSSNNSDSPNRINVQDNGAVRHRYSENIDEKRRDGFRNDENNWKLVHKNEESRELSLTSALRKNSDDNEFRMDSELWKKLDDGVGLSDNQLSRVGLDKHMYPKYLAQNLGKDLHVSQSRHFQYDREFTDKNIAQNFSKWHVDANMGQNKDTRETTGQIAAQYLSKCSYGDQNERTADQNSGNPAPVQQNSGQIRGTSKRGRFPSNFSDTNFEKESHDGDQTEPLILRTDSVKRENRTLDCTPNFIDGNRETKEFCRINSRLKSMASTESESSLTGLDQIPIPQLGNRRLKFTKKINFSHPPPPSLCSLLPSTNSNFFPVITIPQSVLYNPQSQIPTGQLAIEYKSREEPPENRNKKMQSTNETPESNSEVRLSNLCQGQLSGSIVTGTCAVGSECRNDAS